MLFIFYLLHQIKIFSYLFYTTFDVCGGKRLEVLEVSHWVDSRMLRYLLLTCVRSVLDYYVGIWVTGKNQ